MDRLPGLVIWQRHSIIHSVSLFINYVAIHQKKELPTGDASEEARETDERTLILISIVTLKALHARSISFQAV